MLSYELTKDQINTMNPDIAVIPVGSLEQHGSHLPVNTDIVVAEAYANEIARQLNAFQIPAIPISTCREHMGYKGSVWMNPDTFFLVMKDICMCLKEQGFKKIVIVQGHGGTFMLTPVVRELNATQNPELYVCKMEPSEYMPQYKAAGIITSNVSVHAEEYETSLMMYLKNELVHTELIQDFIPDVPRGYLNYGSIFCASPTGVWGSPSLATAEKGKLLYELGSRLMLEDIKNIFDYMKNKRPHGNSNF